MGRRLQRRGTRWLQPHLPLGFLAGWLAPPLTHCPLAGGRRLAIEGGSGESRRADGPSAPSAPSAPPAPPARRRGRAPPRRRRCRDRAASRGRGGLAPAPSSPRRSSAARHSARARRAASRGRESWSRVVVATPLRLGCDCAATPLQFPPLLPTQ